MSHRFHAPRAGGFPQVFETASSRRAVVALGIGIAAGGIAILLGTFAAAEEPLEKPSIQLTFDFGDGFQKRYTQLQWTDGMTVMGALESAAKHPRGIRFKHRGRGLTAFVYQIDDLENEGAGRAWLYQVNEKRADRSAAVYRLKAGDTILWEFDKY